MKKIKKKKEEKQFSEVQQHIKYKKEVNPGSYKGICNYCNKFWAIASL